MHVNGEWRLAMPLDLKNARLRTQNKVLFLKSYLHLPGVYRDHYFAASGYISGLFINVVGYGSYKEI